MTDDRLFEHIKDSIMVYVSIDLYDIDDLLEELEIELEPEEKESFEEMLDGFTESLSDDYIDQIAFDIMGEFKELLKDKLPKYPEDAPGQLHLFEE